MDIDRGAPQTYLSGPSHACAAPKFNSAPLSGGLMRYHSAPSCLLAGLLDDDFFAESDDPEFSRRVSDGLVSLSSLLDPKTTTVQQADSKLTSVVTREDDFLADALEKEQGSCLLGGDINFPEQSLSAGHLLPVIPEYGLEETVAQFCMPLPTESTHVAPSESAHVSGGISYTSGCAAGMQVESFSPVLIKQNSTPAEAFSRLVMEDSSEIETRNRDFGRPSAVPYLPGTDGSLVHQSLQVPPFHVTTGTTHPDVTCTSVVSTVSSSSRRTPNVLLRHSSSPAGLLSQINMEDFVAVKEEASVLEGGHNHDLGHQRKRGRASDEQLLIVLQRSPSDQLSASSKSPSPGIADHMETLVDQSVLCKARAKRGCATHPRSIAERQRRIKISERIKKLEDLVPNLDKLIFDLVLISDAQQASTAEMLDEVVEYVKLLQQQVQELTANPRKCALCQRAGGSPSQAQD